MISETADVQQPHADMNQEINCGLMVVSHFDMQELQERIQSGVYIQS